MSEEKREKEPGRASVVFRRRDRSWRSAAGRLPDSADERPSACAYEEEAQHLLLFLFFFFSPQTPYGFLLSFDSMKANITSELQWPVTLETSVPRT